MIKSSQKELALERIEKLFEEAKKSFKRYPERSNRYVQLARKIAMKVKVRVPKEYKKKFCKHCYRYLQPGINCRVRVRKGKVIYYCFNCKKYMRYVI